MVLFQENYETRMSFCGPLTRAIYSTEEAAQMCRQPDHNDSKYFNCQAVVGGRTAFLCARK